MPMLDLLGADQYVSMVWNVDLGRFHRFTALNLSADSLRDWDRYYRLIDPLTFPLMERRHPTLVTQVLPQQALMKTEFFNGFLRPERMHWGVNVYFFDRQTCVGDFRIFRHRERGNFEPNHLEVLRMVEPAISGALARLHWESQCAPALPETELAEEVLQRSVHLSRREAEVAWLVACGCPDKQIARRLDVGYPTVRFHLANAFKKLRTENRAALAARVLSLVESHRHVSGRTAVG